MWKSTKFLLGFGVIVILLAFGQLGWQLPRLLPVEGAVLAGTCGGNDCFDCAADPTYCAGSTQCYGPRSEGVWLAVVPTYQGMAHIVRRAAGQMGTTHCTLSNPADCHLIYACSDNCEADCECITADQVFADCAKDGDICWGDGG
jgi:hypothetical protein